MIISSGFNSALSGIRSGFENLEKNATKIANSSVGDENGTGSLAEAVVGLKLSEIQIKSSMQVVKTLDEVLGSLLDVKA